MRRLFISHELAGSFIEEPDVAGIAESWANNSSESLAGGSFSSYEILSKLGAGAIYWLVSLGRIR
jgi:hypothetical protein